MKRLFRLFLVLFLLILVLVIGMVSINFISFSSKQIPVDAIEPFELPDTIVQTFQKAIQIPTISSILNREDSLQFNALHELIKKDFPLVDSMLNREVIADLSAVYHWQGRRPDLAPILLMAHTDVVPVEEASLSKWTQDPFSGVLADEYIWGRGTLDDKACVLGILSAIEVLLQENYLPERTIYLAFGHDEEVGGTGAVAIADYFKKRKIEFEYILDEGLIIVEDALDGLNQPLAMIGIAEKGYATLTLTASLKEGGHSMMPPKETAVGVLSKAITRLQENPFPAKISGGLAGLLRYAGPEMDLFNKIVLSNLWLTESLVLNSLSQTPSSNAMTRTTIAPTMVRGGVQDNVLPTRASAKINFRILPGETIESVIAYVKKVVNDDRVIVSLANPDHTKNPSPVSSTSSFGFQVIQKTTKQVFPEVAVSPGLVIGFTDSRHFVDLSEHIYRFAPIQLEKADLNAFHGIDEKIKAENYKDMIRFYRQLILNSCR